MSTLPPVNKGSRGADGTREAPTQLARDIVAHIRAHGPITFRDFMERALYEPGSGYYARAHTPWSGSSDFVTAPQVDASFGVAMANLARECDAALGGPERFDLIEIGGGDGALLADTCDALSRNAADLYRRLQVHAVERGEAARAEQRRRLSAHATRVRWHEALDELPAASLRGLVFSNELLDALPVHRVVCRDGRLRELFVAVDDDALVERAMDPSTPELAGYLRFNEIALQEGQVAEISLEAGRWIESLARLLERGYVATVDYGAETTALYGSGRLEGSLVCQHRFQLNAAPYERVGEQDITAHVDLGNLRRRGQGCGLETVGVAGLAVFLLGFGAADELGRMAAAEDGAAVRRRLGLRHLLFTEIGDAHRVMLQSRNAPAIPFGRERLE